MKFTFTGKKVNLSNRVQSYAEKKVGKLERYFKTEPEASLVFSVEKDRNKVELTIRSATATASEPLIRIIPIPELESAVAIAAIVSVYTIYI